MTAVIILAAGQGTRMKSKLPKVLHPLGGKAMVHHVMDVAQSINPSRTVVVVSPHLDSDLVKDGRDVAVAIQKEALGTGDAALSALAYLQDDKEEVLILCGDAPLIESETLKKLCQARKKGDVPEILMLAMDLADPRQYGRLVTKGDVVESIVEHKDATVDQRAITLCNPGVYLVPLSLLKQILPKLSPKNAAGEIYLTDIVQLAKEQGVPTRFITADNPETLHGINNRMELAHAEVHLQRRWREHWMLSGVTMLDPETVYLYHDTIIGQDSVIHPHVTFGPMVVVEEDVTIFSHTCLQKTKLMKGAKAGPFVHLREGTILGERAEVGNFVECKHTTFGEKAKAKHLAYLGDATLGDRANIGAGTITCNYDGFEKSKTTIGEGAFIGCNTSLIAPVHVGEGAIVAAGSVITADVPEHSLGIARLEQINKPVWAKNFREMRAAKKTK